MFGPMGVVVYKNSTILSKKTMLVEICNPLRRVVRPKVLWKNKLSEVSFIIS